ncbi:MAG: hypothetical protein II956_08585 [Bacteroidales bacterium]|nr:hypothetical protein [Bacteroidales bacterium]
MKHTILTLCFLTFFGSLFAQNKGQDFLSLTIGGGYHAINYKLDGYGDKTNGFGFAAKLGYEHFFSSEAGISTGVMTGCFKTSTTLNYLQTIDKAVDEDNNIYTHRTYFNSLKESQKQTMLIIPAEFVYRFSLSSKIELWLSGGLFGGFTLKSDFKTEKGNLETRRFYYEQNLEVYGDYPMHGLYTENSFSAQNSLKPVLGGIFEPNFLVRLTEKVDLKCGFYFLYSFTAQNKQDSENLYDPESKNYNGFFNSHLTDKTHPMLTGFLLGANYSF